MPRRRKQISIGGPCKSTRKVIVPKRERVETGVRTNKVVRKQMFGGAASRLRTRHLARSLPERNPRTHSRTFAEKNRISRSDLPNCDRFRRRLHRRRQALKRKKQLYPRCLLPSAMHPPHPIHHGGEDELHGGGGQPHFFIHSRPHTSPQRNRGPSDSCDLRRGRSGGPAEPEQRRRKRRKMPKQKPFLKRPD